MHSYRSAGGRFAGAPTSQFGQSIHHDSEGGPSPCSPPTLAIGVLGLVIGSFLNVVIYRVPRDESIVRPGSHCPSCDRTRSRRAQHPGRRLADAARALRQLRRARSARATRSSKRSPARCSSPSPPASASAPLLPAYLYLAAIAIALAAIDFDVQRLPDSIVLPSYVVGVVLLMPAGAVDGDWRRPRRGLLAMAGLFALYFALAIAYPGGMGFGDVKLAGLLGLYLGWISWGSVVVATFGAFLLGGLAGGVPDRRAPGQPQERHPVRPVHARRRVRRAVLRRRRIGLVRPPAQPLPAQRVI